MKPIDILIEGLKEALTFSGIDQDKIYDIESNCGGLWFSYENNRYFILIDECGETGVI